VLRKIWLIFAQACAVCLAALFVVTTLRPDLLSRGDKITVVESPPGGSAVGARSGTAMAGYSQAVKRAMPAVVNIYTSKEIRKPRNPLLDDPLFRQFFADNGEVATQRTASLGSGVIVSPQGYVLTNHHVVEGADEIELMLSNGRKLTAKVVGTDPETDLAVLKANADKLPAIAFGSADKLQVGDVVLAIGNPFGFGGTVTQGIISALGRNFGINTFESFIQTDAAINPGNSGGALIDVDGNLVGINSNIFSRSGGSEGIGFAIPVSIARSVMDSIIQTGTVTRGYLGVSIGSEITPDLSRDLGLNGVTGVVIEGVVRSGPADRAGIRPKDILIEVDGTHIEDSAAMLNQIAAIPPGRNVAVKIWREGRNLSLNIQAGKRPLVKRG
jgi:serine protease DegQ